MESECLGQKSLDGQKGIYVLDLPTLINRIETILT